MSKQKKETNLGAPTESFLLPTRTKNVLIENGYVTAADFQGKFREDIQELKGISKASALEVFEYLNLKFGVKIKKRPADPKTKEEKELYFQARKIVEHFLSHNSFINWGKEVTTAKNLIKNYGFDLLMSVPTFPWLKSLPFLFTEKGKKHITSYLKPVRLIEEKPKEVSIFDEDFTFDFEDDKKQVKKEDKKPKNLKDWLKK